MNQRLRPARVVIREPSIFFECPYCGITLLRTNLSKVMKLDKNKAGEFRGKVCGQCGATVVLVLTDKIRKLAAEHSTEQPEEVN